MIIELDDWDNSARGEWNRFLVVFCGYFYFLYFFGEQESIDVLPKEADDHTDSNGQIIKYSIMHEYNSTFRFCVISDLFLITAVYFFYGSTFG
jgi:hypothetical protein